MELENSALAAPEVSYARRAADIPEICHMICECLSDSHEPLLDDGSTEERVNRKALACLARTSRGFFYLAIPILWGGKQIYINELLTLLPGVVRWKMKSSPSDHGIKAEDIPDPLPRDYFDRFNIYAPYVNHLVSSGTIYSERRPHSLRTLLSHTQNHVLLPNLVSFASKSRSRLVHDTSISMLLDWMGILISPSLTKLDIGHGGKHIVDEERLSEATVEKYYQVISASITRCPNLRHLGYFYNGRPSMHYPGFLSGHKIVPANLTYLRCQCAVFCPEFLHWLEGMPQLKVLELTDPDGFLNSFAHGYTSSPNPFSNLKCLKLNTPHRLICTQIWRTSLVQHLTRLEMFFGHDSDWVEETIPNFCQLLVEKSPGLTELSLRYHEVHNISVESLQILRNLSLRKLSIPDGTRNRIGGPQAVRNLIQLWPQLEELDLGSYEAEFEELWHILPFCWQLSALRLRIYTHLGDLPFQHLLRQQVSRPAGVSVPFTLMTSQPISGSLPLEEQYELDEIESLARYLACMRPYMKYQVCPRHQEVWQVQEHKFLRGLNSMIQDHSKLESNEAK